MRIDESRAAKCLSWISVPVFRLPCSCSRFRVCFDNTTNLTRLCSVTRTRCYYCRIRVITRDQLDKTGFVSYHSARCSLSRPYSESKSKHCTISLPLRARVRRYTSIFSNAYTMILFNCQSVKGVWTSHSGHVKQDTVCE